MGWFASKQPLRCQRPARIAQITDCHLLVDNGLYQGIDPVASLRRVLQALSQQQWDCVLVTGDISQDHTDASYRLLADLCREYLENTPVARLAGNHDSHESIAGWLSAAPFITANHLQLDHWHILLVDSKGPTPAGLINDKHMSEIAAALKQIPGNEPVGIFVHHHPLPMNAYIDKHILTNGADLMALLAGFEQVKFLAHGHVHQQFDCQLNRPRMPNIGLYATPSTAMQFAALGMARANDDLGPAYRKFELYPGGAFSTDVVWLNQQ